MCVCEREREGGREGVEEVRDRLHTTSATQVAEHYLCMNRRLV